jgi:radical SAM superfamily enzyme YgiQ (UPF0313 family)
MATLLDASGFTTDLVDCELADYPPERAVDVILARRPAIVGLTLLTFLCEASAVAVVRLLRRRGYTGLVLIGGRYPTVSYDRLYELLGDQVDAICVGEGEYTMRELAEKWRAGQDWHDVRGLAFRRDGKVHLTGASEMVDPLDTLPFPKRFNINQIIKRAAAVSVLGTRGCWFGRCTFCSVSTLELSQGKAPARRRRPDAIVSEMVHLHDAYGADNFMIVSDSFIGPGRKGKAEMSEFVDLLGGCGHRFTFGFACQPLDADHALFSRLKDVGMTSVFLGIETGSERTLKYYRKPSNITQNRRSSVIIKDLNLNVGEAQGLGGFIFYNPASTMHDVKENLSFLEEYGLVCDIAFFSHCYLLTNTPLEREMAEKGLKTPYDRKGYYIVDPGVQLLTELVVPLDELLNRDLDRVINYQFQYARAYAKQNPDREHVGTLVDGSRENLWKAYDCLRKLIFSWYRRTIAAIENSDLTPMAKLMAEFHEDYERVLNEYAESTLMLAMETGGDLPSAPNDFFPQPPLEWIARVRQAARRLETAMPRPDEVRAEVFVDQEVLHRAECEPVRAHS